MKANYNRLLIFFYFFISIIKVDIGESGGLIHLSHCGDVNDDVDVHYCYLRVGG
jgi:hypothetical protein